MKDYYIFSKDGNSLKISKEHDLIKLTNGSIWFDKQNLIKQLEEFLVYLKKHG